MAHTIVTKDKNFFDDIYFFCKKNKIAFHYDDELEEITLMTNDDNKIKHCLDEFNKNSINYEYEVL